jgi:hypothetical protein
MDLHLSFAGSSSRIISSFLELLATDSPSQLLPNLRNLTLDCFSPDDSQYEKLLKIFTARRSRMRTFRLTWPSPPPPADILVGMRELVAGGMEIHIGTQDL